MDHHVTRAVYELLLARQGLFSVSDAAVRGVDRRALVELVRAGRLLRVKRGWLADAAAEGERLHLLRALAHLRDMQRPAAVSHTTAVLAHELPTLGPAPDVVHFSGPSAARSRGSLRLHRRSPDSPVVTVPVLGTGARLGSVPAADAVAGHGALAGVRGFVVAADAAAQTGLCTVHDLHRAVHALAGGRQAGRLRWALDEVDPGAESPGESLLRLDLRSLGFTVTSQVRVVAGGRRYRADFAVDGERVLVEFDGVGKYDAGGQAIRAEKDREQRLRDTGWVVVRFLWQDLGHLALIKTRVDAAIRQARVLRAAA